MLGTYENFPGTIHGATHLAHATSIKKVQQALVTTLSQLNQNGCNLETITGSLVEAPRCEVNFEVGVGEETWFTFLDESEAERLDREISRKALPLLDFLCILQYHLVRDSGKRSPLRFDYFLLRFAFAKNLTELLVTHERGTRRVHVEDLMRFLTGRVEKRLEEDRLVDTSIRGRREA